METKTKGILEASCPLPSVFDGCPVCDHGLGRGSGGTRTESRHLSCERARGRIRSKWDGDDDVLYVGGGTDDRGNRIPRICVKGVIEVWKQQCHLYLGPIVWLISCEPYTDGICLLDGTAAWLCGSRVFGASYNPASYGQQCHGKWDGAFGCYKADDAVWNRRALLRTGAFFNRME